MAAKLPMQYNAYGKIERGETDPPASRLSQIAEILNVDIAQLFNDNTSANTLQDDAASYESFVTSEVHALKERMLKQEQLIQKVKEEITALQAVIKKK